ncbi:MAG TPA: DUF389 domain-containing protein, partial [Ilumatobacteraceae bacterium]
MTTPFDDEHRDDTAAATITADGGTVSALDLPSMRDSVFFDGADLRQRLSRFWILLTLAAIIASAGVVADSTATVIGAMIVAPLMTPILGTMLAVVVGDRANLFRCILLVVGGALAAIAIGYLVGVLVLNDVVAASNSQVAGRVHPRLIDMLAALATGVVGSVALVRRDISDTLPGVAIAISLVPPLTVVGLTAEAGAYDESAGALLLFGTNVAAILATGIVVMALYRVHRLVAPAADPGRRAVNRRNAILLIVALFVVIGVPLTISTVKISRETSIESDVRAVTSEWAGDRDWRVLDVQHDQDGVVILLGGPPPLPDTASLA